MSKKVLIIEDESQFLTLLCGKLEKEGYDVSYASDGEEAVRKFKAVHPDVILLDILLPKQDGFTVLEEIRGLKDSDIPVLVLTNLSSDEDRKRGDNLNVADYMVKSDVSLAQVVEKVGTLE